MNWTQKLRCTMVTFLCTMMGVNATAQIPGEITYQAYLADGAGQPVDAPVNVQFALYAMPAGGAPLWADTQTIVPSKGLFTTTLGGTAAPFPAGLFATPVYLGLAIDGDAEMTPRRAFTSVASAYRSLDSDTVGGLPAAALNQSSDVSALGGSLAGAQADIAQLEIDQSATGSDVAALQVGVSGALTSISQLQTDLFSTDSGLTAVENLLPTLQTQVSSFCAAGSSIRQIFPNGLVNCESDDEGPWIDNGSRIYHNASRVGIGTSSPTARVQIDASAAETALRARVAGSTKLMVHSNGNVSVGTALAGSDNGLYVIGDTGLGTQTPAARLTASDDNWQVSMRNPGPGGIEWYLGSSRDSWSTGGGKFVISPSTGSSGAAMVIDANKNVGVGTLSPLTKMHINGGSDVSPGGGGFLTVGSATGNNIAIDNNEIMARKNGATASLALNAEGGKVTVNVNGTAFDDAMEIVGEVEMASGTVSSILFSGAPTNAGQDLSANMVPNAFEKASVGSPSRPFFSMYARTFFAAGPFNYQSYSDRSLKGDVKPIEGALDTIGRLEGVKYALLKHPFDTSDRERTPKEQFARQNQMGFIAQDVEKVLPQLVLEDESSGLKSVGYMGVIPVLVEAIKELEERVEAQQKEIDDLKRSAGVARR